MTEPMEDLRRQFVAAARQQAEPSRGRRWWRRRVAMGVGILLATGAVAEGVNLVSVGDPVERSTEAAKTSGPVAGGGTVDVTSVDPDRTLPFAVVVYRRNGRRCVTAGQLRGAELGEIRGGEFRSFEGRIGGACIAPAQRFVTQPQTVDGRTLVFGRVDRGIDAVVAHVKNGPSSRAKTGPGGGFLFVFDKDVPGLSVSIVPDTR